MKYREALFLTEEDMNKMIVWGTDICKKCGIIDDVSTLRRLRLKNPIAITKAEEQVFFKVKKLTKYADQEV